jgi:hypothetical protein
MTTATITDEFKQTLIDYVYEDFRDSSSYYYIGIGRAQPWEAPDSDTSPPIPNPSDYEAMKFRDNVQSIKRVEDLAHVVERYNYTAGNIYSGWNNDNHSFLVYNAAELGIDPCIGDFGFKHPFYVITSSNRVYTCIKQGVGDNGLPRPSSVQPNEIGEVGFNVFETSDNYQWKYLYTVGTNATQKFLTSGYIPSQRIIDSDEGGKAYDDLDFFEQEQATLQRRAVKGQVVGVEIVDGGTGYPNTNNTADPTQFIEISFVAEPLFIDGAYQTVTDARAWARVVNGKIVDVTMKEPGTSDFYFGQNYYNAEAKIVGSPVGSGAVLRPIVSYDMGLGYDASEDLISTGLMFNVILQGTENGEYIVGNDFRQIGLLRNPMGLDSDGLGNTTYSPLTVTRTVAMPSMTINAGDPNLNAENITGDNILEQGSTGAKGVLISVQDDIFYYTQTQETGYTPFELGAITISNGGGSTSISALTPSPLVKQSGEVYYIDNREPFIRNAEQTEDIKLVMDF